MLTMLNIAIKSTTSQHMSNLTKFELYNKNWKEKKW